MASSPIVLMQYRSIIIVYRARFFAQCTPFIFLEEPSEAYVVLVPSLFYSDNTIRSKQPFSSLRIEYWISVVSSQVDSTTILFQRKPFVAIALP